MDEVVEEHERGPAYIPTSSAQTDVFFSNSDSVVSFTCLTRGNTQPRHRRHPHHTYQRHLSAQVQSLKYGNFTYPEISITSSCAQAAARGVHLRRAAGPP